MFYLRLLLILCAGLSLGTAGPDKTLLDTCKVSFINGTSSATNNDDRCPSVSDPVQAGVNDPTAAGFINCNRNTRPPFYKTTLKSCQYDGINDSHFLADGAFGPIEYLSVWVYPTTSDTSIIYDDLWAGVGSRVLVVNCDTDKLLLRFQLEDELFNTDCDSVHVNEWNFIGVTFEVFFPRLYTSFPGVDDTLLAHVGDITLLGWGNPTLSTNFGKGAFNVLPFTGFMVDWLLMKDVLQNDEVACLICRGSAGNLYRQNGVNNFAYDARDSCNVCDINADPAFITHVGPRRRQN